MLSKDKAAKIYETAGNVCIDTDDEAYFSDYFDLSRDYDAIIRRINECGIPKVIDVSKKYSGIRILKQDTEEAFFSFIISQNNNIPRIKSTIEKLSETIGKECRFKDVTYHAFPTAAEFYSSDMSLLKEAGLGYRAEYIKEASEKILSGEIDFSAMQELSTEELRKQLLKIKGVGDKVANCVTLFGFSRGDSFPVDTWIEKIYREDFNGTLTDRTKISRYFLDLFGENSGYVQQYLFYAKREKFI